MRIAIVTETWKPSVNGVVTRLTATVRELLGRGHRVLVVAPSTSEPDAPAPDLPDVTVRRVPSVGVPFIYGGQHWGLPLPRVIKLLDGFGRTWSTPSARSCSAGPACCTPGPAECRWCALTTPTSPATPTSTASASPSGRCGRSSAGRTGRAHVNLAASEAARAELEAHGVRDVGVWPGGVDLTLFHPGHASPQTRRRLTGGHPDRRICLYVGRLASEKGVERLLPLAGERRHLALVGDGPARADLEGAFGGAQATFTGPLAGADLAAAYASADVFVFPSTTDTLGLVVLEAMASGLPVAAARTEAAVDLLRSAPAAGLFDADDAAQLVSEVDRQLDARVDPDRVAAAARDRVPGWREATDTLLDGYERAIGLARRAVAA